MKHFIPPFKIGILQKLLVMHLLVLAVSLSITFAVFLSFREIDEFSRTIINTDINQVIVNAQLGRDLNSVIADTDLLISTFLNRDEEFRKEITRIIAKAGLLEHKVSDNNLKSSIKYFNSSQKALFDQCVIVYNHSRKLEQLEQQLSTEISTLENTLSERLVNLSREGKDVSILEQLSIIIPGYRETVLQISIQHTKLRLKHPETSDTSPGRQIQALLDDLHLRLRTLTASDPVISTFGKRLMKIVNEYKTTSLLFLDSMNELRIRLRRLNTDENMVLSAMATADRNISQTASNLGKDISSVMQSTGGFIFAIAGVLVVSLGFFTVLFSHRNIRLPMQLILQGIESIRSGNLETRIRLNRKDEWNAIEEALNRMVSERLEGEEALRESEQQLAAIIQGSPIPTFVINKHQIVTHWNKALEQLSSVRADDVIGSDRSWMAFYDEQRPVLANLLAKEDTASLTLWYGGKFSKSRLAEEAYEATDFFPKWADGGKWLHFTAATLRDTRGTLLAPLKLLRTLPNE